MTILEYATSLWKNHCEYKSTLQGRLTLFFTIAALSILLLFTMLLTVFGITGSEKTAVKRYFEGENTYISDAVESDFGHISLIGIRLSENISGKADRLFEKYGIKASSLNKNPDILNALLAGQMDDMISVAENNSCGGVFIILDASENGASDKKSGFFIKKTEPISSAVLASKLYCLRGSAAIARENGIELLGQWQMQYDSSEFEFFDSVMQTAREYPSLPLSRLYYWTERVSLNAGSEMGLMLCVPIRSNEGIVFGVCGIEVSDRMFKKLYTPNENGFQGVFTIAAPKSGNILFADNGLIAGNSYLTDNQMTDELIYKNTDYGFSVYRSPKQIYAGLAKTIRLYSAGSPYEDEQWTVVTLMPKPTLEKAVRGNSSYLFFIVAVLMVFSIAAAVFISNQYLKPIKRGLDSLSNKEYENSSPNFGIEEIDNLFECLSQDVKQNRLELERLSLECKEAELRFAEAQTQIDRLTDKRKQEIDPEEYLLFLERLKTLTNTEKKIFDLYLAGNNAEEILEKLQIKQNTLKYHNRNIFGKLGVTSRKQLLMFAAVIQQENKEAPQKIY